MASKAFSIAVLVAMVAVPSLATDYLVGDESGWALGVNYTAWAEGKMFYVGDRLMFLYTEGSHNVLKVNGTDFKQCATSNTTGALTSGNDVVTLATPGKKWYICGVGDHCTEGMKLVIIVLESEAPAPEPAPLPTLTLTPTPTPTPAVPAPTPAWSPYSYPNTRIFRRY